MILKCSISKAKCNSECLCCKKRQEEAGLGHSGLMSSDGCPPVLRELGVVCLRCLVPGFAVKVVSFTRAIAAGKRHNHTKKFAGCPVQHVTSYTGITCPSGCAHFSPHTPFNQHDLLWMLLIEAPSVPTFGLQFSVKTGFNVTPLAPWGGELELHPCHTSALMRTPAWC